MRQTKCFLSWVGINRNLGPQILEKEDSAFSRLWSRKSFRPPMRGHGQSCAVIPLCYIHISASLLFLQPGVCGTEGNWLVHNWAAWGVAASQWRNIPPYSTNPEQQFRAGSCKWCPSYKPQSLTTPVTTTPYAIALLIPIILLLK